MKRFILPWVASATGSFVHADDVREALSLALVSGKHLILYGPGGHAKSEMIGEVTAAIVGATMFVQSFGEGMDESRLYGGIDLPALNAGENARIQYRPEHSFLAADVAVLEELFDSPTAVLLSLKDTLTSGYLRNGVQRYKMQTSCIVSATNRSPSEVAALGPAANALIERFPLQLEVNWPSYEATDYLEMFNSVTHRGTEKVSAVWNGVVGLRNVALRVEMPSRVEEVLAAVIAGSVRNGHFISPRTAMHARGLAQAAAAIRGSTVACEEDLVVIRYLPGLAEAANQISSDIETATVRADAERRLQVFVNRVQGLANDPKWESGSSNELLLLQKQASKLSDELYDLRLPDEHYRQGENLRYRLEDFQRRAIDLALERVDDKGSSVQDHAFISIGR